MTFSAPAHRTTPPDGAIDAVITWVDGNDPQHQAKLNRHLAELGRRPVDAAPTRFRSVGEIDHCVRSLLRHAPFLRRIHIITDDQVPPILQEASRWPEPWRGRVVRVDHREVFAGHLDVLPTFNCRSIETVMHRIPGLAEQFIYLNDDFMLIKPVQPGDWFRDGQPVLRGRWLVPPEQRWSRRLRALWQGWLGREITDRAGHKDAQATSARLAGFADRYFWVDHHPHPMRRSTIEAFHRAHPGLLARNIGFRLRDASQFNPQSLAAHLELKAGTAWPQRAAQVVNVKPPSMSHAALMRRLAAAERDPGILFACIQSLDEADDRTLADVQAWWGRVIGPAPVPTNGPA